MQSVTKFLTEVVGLSLMVCRTEAGWEASIAGPLSLMTLETAQRAAANMASVILGREVSNIAWKTA
jgi:hypothetical protein